MKHCVQYTQGDPIARVSHIEKHQMARENIFNFIVNHCIK